MYPEKVTIQDTEEAIAKSIIALANKTQGHTCRKCKELNPDISCTDCLHTWYDARNSCIRILRSIFDLPTKRDVPAPIFHFATHHANDIMSKISGDGFIRGIKRLKKLHTTGELMSLIPPDITCPACGNVVSASRYGYCINTTEKVCWECDMNHRDMKAKVVNEETE